MFYTKKSQQELAAMITAVRDENNTQLENRLASVISEFDRKLEDAAVQAAEREAQLVETLKTTADALFQEALVENRRKRYESDEPFVEIISQTFTEENGVQLRLDWNKPFIEYLRKNGVTGPTDEAIVDNWLVSLSRERIAEAGSEFK